MINVDSYLRIFRWRGLTGKELLDGNVEPRETTVAMIQLAALARQSSPLHSVMPAELYQILRQQVDDKGMLHGAMSEPVNRQLFLSDLYDFLVLFKRFEEGWNESC